MLLLIVFLSLNATTAQAFVVSPLPGDNLVTNPWFNSGSNTSLASLDGWTNVLKNGVGWIPSDKDQNPSPYGEMGTAARWAEMNEVVYPNVDVYLYQVISADSAQRKLRFSTWWVSHRVDVLEYTVYGSSSAQGPWTKVWTPLSVSVAVEEKPASGDKDDLWKNTGLKETTISTGYPYYKLEIHARYPQPLTTAGSQGVGLKVTGVYFSTQLAGSEPNNPEPTVTVTKTRLPGTSPTPVVTQTSPPNPAKTPNPPRTSRP